MVKLHIITERTFRYNRRCNKKQVSEMKYIINEKTDEVHGFIEHTRQLTNTLSRTNGFNKVIYHAYSGLYKKYIEVIQDFDRLRVSMRDTETKLKETTELYENLEDVYNEKVAECERLKKTEIKKEC
jgi:predicted RNase H-like nuclease